MCELLGIYAAKPTQTAEYLKAFYAHSVFHPHGWGIMYGQHQIMKEPVRACDSAKLAALIEQLPPQKLVLGHIRFATVGRVRVENCHPYTGTDLSGRTWTLIHNGTIFSGKLNFQYFKKQTGDTDSERLFLALLDTVNESLCRGASSDKERFETVSRFIASNASRNKLNLMIYDGDMLYVHKNMKNTLSYKKLPDGFVFSTQPLDNSEWISFPMAQTIAFQNGKELYRSRPHKGIYVPVLETISPMDAMHI